MGFLGVLRVKMWKYCVLTPKRHYSAWIRVCWCIACQNRFNGLSSRSVERFCVQRKKEKKLSGNFGYMGGSNHWGDLDQMWLVGRYRGRNHVCNISWLRLRGVGVVRGVSLPSPIDLTRRPYNTGHTTVWYSIMYEVNYNGRTSYESNYCRVRAEGSLRSNIDLLLQQRERFE